MADEQRNSLDRLAELGIRPEDLVSQKADLKIDFLSLPPIWVPCPATFPEGEGAASWASESARWWWDNSGLKHRQRDVAFLAETFAGIHQIIYSPESGLPLHFAVLHLPAIIGPLPVMFGVWPTVGDPETQMKILTGTGHPELLRPAIAEEFRTERLGSGQKSLAYFAVYLVPR
jgi:hypothetical protein